MNENCAFTICTRSYIGLAKTLRNSFLKCNSNFDFYIIISDYCLTDKNEKYCIDSHDEVYGFLYGIDVKKPVVKLYRGYLNRACTNLSVFNPSWMNVQELIPGEPININPLTQLMESQNEFEITLNKLKDETISRNDRKMYLGNWVDHALRENEDYGFGKVKIATSTPIDAYKKLFIDSDSQYYIPEGIDPTLFDIYNSFTQIITDDKKDILNKFEKTIIVGKLLNFVK